MLEIIINCGPCQDFIGTVPGLRARPDARRAVRNVYVTVDPCGDDTHVRAVLAAAGNPPHPCPRQSDPGFDG